MELIQEKVITDTAFVYFFNHQTRLTLKRLQRKQNVGNSKKLGERKTLRVYDRGSVEKEEAVEKDEEEEEAAVILNRGDI